jgi:hypothetical protein
MIEKIIPLDIPPGLYKNGTEYQARGRWYDANGIRFENGTIQPIGGWRQLTDSAGVEYAALSGCPRGAYSYLGDNGALRVLFGTSTKLYAITGGALVDITTASSFVSGSCGGSFADGSGEYGAGDYGAGPYGGLSLGSTLINADSWQIDNYGDYAVAVFSADGRLFLWDGDALTNADPVTGAPTNNKGVVVTPERFVMLLGAGGDPRLVQWADQEAPLSSADDWTPTASNQAGDQPLATAGHLMAGRRTRRQTLIWSTVDVWTATYIGVDNRGVGNVYVFDQVGDNCGLMGPNAVAMAGTKAYWMGDGSFFEFDGYTQAIPCDVADYVFSDINRINKAIIHAQTISQRNEIWWFYPSRGSSFNNRYVVYNYREKHWTVGTLARESGVDKGASPAVIMVDTNGILWEQEVENGKRSDIITFLQSGPIEIMDGDRVVRVQHIIPDEAIKGQVRVVVRKRFYPNDAFTDTGSYFMTGSDPVDTRFTARQLSLRIFENEAGASWRIGRFRLGVLPQGRR